VIVEYLNPYCAHCRATHQRLDHTIVGMGLATRRFRVYSWASDDVPLWARACALAEPLGYEPRLFEELMRARDPGPAEVYAAAQRAGLDVGWLQQALQSPSPPARLLRDRRIASSAGLRGLPTLDIGRRRLMGEQSAAELRDALLAALPPPTR
jgi:predicted DsbA family dithiol-disulfide isomerase